MHSFGFSSFFPLEVRILFVFIIPIIIMLIIRFIIILIFICHIKFLSPDKYPSNF